MGKKVSGDKKASKIKDFLVLVELFVLEFLEDHLVLVVILGERRIKFKNLTLVVLDF